MAIGDHLDAIDLGTLSPNTEIHRQVPQVAVGHHAAAFITHAGMGSVTEALYHQAPHHRHPRETALTNAINPAGGAASGADIVETVRTR
jgi:UDP-glucoronosyl and UDP-glucosyl transferase